MEERTGHPLFYEILDDMARIHGAKNKDYGNGKHLGNFQEAAELGVEPWRGALVRASDKWSRIKSLANRPDQTGAVDESLEDTLVDLANYCVLVLILRREAQAKAKPQYAPCAV